MKQCLMKSVDFPKTQKSKYLENKENIIFYASRKNSFVAEVTFNTSVAAIMAALIHVEYVEDISHHDLSS